MEVCPTGMVLELPIDLVLYVLVLTQVGILIICSL